MDRLNGKYNDIINFLNDIVREYCVNKRIQININIPAEDKLNAEVYKIGDRKYNIDIYSACLNLYYQIEEMTKRYTADDLQTFFRFKKLEILEKFEEYSYRDELNNLFGSIILLQIFWHEVGHIDAGYIDRKGNYAEFDSEEKGCYAKQEQEMVADWFSTVKVFEWIYYVTIDGKVSDNDELIIALKQLIELYWISLTIEFQIFDSKHTVQIEDFSLLTHPYPAVRLLYSLDAMCEAVVNIFNLYGMNDEVAEKCMHVVMDSIFIYIQSFMQITKSPIDIKKEEKRVIECYKKLREIPYTNDYDKNEFHHLQQLSHSDLEAIDKIINNK